MKKQEIIQEIVEQVSVTSTRIVRVYGVSNGIGYDLDFKATFKNGFAKEFEAHCYRSSWDCIGHLKPNQRVFNAYKGSDNEPLRYERDVMNYWQGKGFRHFLERHSKDELNDLYNQVKKSHR